jgi:PAS domain S-box-containing protein
VTLDLRTIVVSCVITDVICILVMAGLWRQGRSRFAGTGDWVVALVCQLAALCLIILRGSIPDMLSMVASNTLAIGGAILVYRGLGRFVGRRVPQIHNYVMLAVFACVHTYFAVVQPDLGARNVNLSIGLLFVASQGAWLGLHGADRAMRGFTRGVGAVFLAYCLVSGVRIAEFVLVPHEVTDYFHSGTFESLVLLSYQALLILHTVTLVLMVNQRLLAEVGAQEEKFSTAFRSSPYAITLTRLSDGLITDVNDGFVGLTGYSHSEVVQRTSTELSLWARPEDRDEVVTALRQTGKAPWKEYPFRKKSGTTFPGLMSAEILRIDNQDYVLSSINDITEHKQNVEALQAYDRELKARNEELTRFSYAVSHDLKSPIVTIQIFLGYLKRDMAANDAVRIEKDLGFIQTAADKMSRLLDELLELARVGHAIRPPIQVSLQSVVGEALALVAGRITDRNVAVVVTDQPYLLHGDSERLVEVFQNLVDNAVKFVGKQPEPRIEIGVECEGPEPVIFVRDNGIGIDPQDQSKLFGAFKKLNPWAEGTGLGLALVQRIIEVHGGRIWVESAGIGQGTTFRFTLPGTRRAVP